MKVTGPGKINAPSVKKAKSKSGVGGSSFSSELDSGVEAPQATSNVAGSAPLTQVDALLSLQEVPTATDSRSKGLKLGGEMLDILDDIRQGILLGVIPHAKLQSLTNLLEEKEGEYLDDDLKIILSEIELRARVELAKLEIDL
jgi:hypothetical protein